MRMLNHDAAIGKKLNGFDAYMTKILKDWNAPGVGVGIVVKDRLVFAKGYGYRDYEKKLPITQNTLFQIASNAKLFTAVAVGLLVEEGKLEWDKPVRQFVPEIQFYNNDLNNTVTIRDMLAHRTGIPKYDWIFHRSNLSRKELFERLKYLEPIQPIRQGYIYTNLMYGVCGYVIECLTNQTWEAFLRKRIFKPLEMNHTLFSIKEMIKHTDYFVPYNEKRDTRILYRIPHYDYDLSVRPAGGIISNFTDLSKWLIALMNNGVYKGKQVIPADVVRTTLTPSFAFSNGDLENKGYGELLNPSYGMGRGSASYQGHYFTAHNGYIDGSYSKISCMPYDGIGVIVFAIGAQSQPILDIVSFNIYERLLGLKKTPWSERLLQDREASKKVDEGGREKAGGERIPNTKPSHSIKDYTGDFEHPAYGVFTVSLKGANLQMSFRNIVLPLEHFHYDRFDSPNDEQYGNGMWSLNYSTNLQGAIDRMTTRLGSQVVTFVRKPDASLSKEKKGTEKHKVRSK